MGMVLIQYNKKEAGRYPTSFRIIFYSLLIRFIAMRKRKVNPHMSGMVLNPNAMTSIDAHAGPPATVHAPPAVNTPIWRR